MPSKPTSKPKKKFDGAYATSLVLIAALGATAGVFAGQYAPRGQTNTAAVTSTTGKTVKAIVATKTIKTVTVRPTITASKKITPVKPRSQPVRVIRQIPTAPIAITRGS